MIESDDEVILEKSEIIMIEESKIDLDKHTYLITWNPDPKQSPDANFQIQHRYHINTVAQYLSSCSCGIMCTEPSQLGNPHYHGWYQCSDDFNLEQLRIVTIKVMNYFGKVKIAKAVSIRKNSYSNVKNCLWYYKKDQMTSMLGMPILTRDSKDDTDWQSITCNHFFTVKLGDKHIEDKISARQQMIEFYKDSSLDIV